MLRTQLREFARLKAWARARRAGLPRPQTVPEACAGKWVAWSPDGLRIVGSGDSPDAALAEATRQGHSQVIFEGIPPKGALRRVFLVAYPSMSHSGG